MRWTWLVIGLAAAALTAREAGAQAAPRAAQRVEADFAECDAAAASKSKDRMEAAAQRLEAAAAALEAERPADALVVRARVLSQCRIPFAGFMRQGALVEESNELLERALRLEPTHLVARFTLGMNHYHAPAFLRRTDDAVRELERVLADHGERADPVVAQAYLYLGMLYERQGRAALAASTWRRGAERFPEHAALREKAASAASGSGDDDVDPSAPPSPLAAGGGYTLAPIVVHASTVSVGEPCGATRLSQQEVFTLPGGTADIFQVFQTLPGVTRVAGDGGDPYVRGGDPAETPIYVDGARLFQPGRFETLSGSLFGVLDPAVMRAAYFSSGGFSARYGNALSGVVALETDARPLERRWRASANLASVGGTLWQPLSERAGLWATTMLTHTRLLLETHGRTGSYPDSPTSEQLMVGIAVEPNDAFELRATALAEADRTTTRIAAHGHDGPYRSKAAARLATVQVQGTTPDRGAFARLTLGASVHENRIRFGVLDREGEDRALTARLEGQLDGTRATLRAGLEAALLEAHTDGTIPAGDQLAPGSPMLHLDREEKRADHLGAYAELEWRASDRLALIGGLRADELPGEADATLDPRLAAAYRIGDWTVRLAGGLFSQGRWRTRYAVPDEGSPAGVPRRARHVVGGVQHDGEIALQAEAYVKRYDRYVIDGDVAADAPRVVAGRAAGLDVMLRPRSIGPVVGWLTYSLLDGQLELEQVSGGEDDSGAGSALRRSRVPSHHDVAHTLTAVTKLAVGAWEVGLTVRYASGRPYTPVTGTAPTGPGAPPEPIYGPVHSRRLPAYHRLDGRLTRLVPVNGGTVVVYVEGLNLLDRGNVMSYTYDAAYRERQPVRTFFADRTLLLGVEARF